MENPRNLNKLLASDAQTLIRINHRKQASARRLALYWMAFEQMETGADLGYVKHVRRLR